ncbi:MAG TPA: hypothetical protein VFA00_11110 [Actinomycetota bacterium]|nr:hypothetical protein [Actinomycetota bacterium]
MHWRTQSRWLRPGLLFMVAQAALVGVWALLAPRSFFRDFPAIGGAWVNALPPYNEHLVRDIGGLNLGFALLFFASASTLDVTLIRTSLGAWLLYALPHFLFHITNMERLSGSEKVFQTLALGALIVVPVGLLMATRRRRVRGLGSLR